MTCKATQFSERVERKDGWRDVEGGKKHGMDEEAPPGFECLLLPPQDVGVEADEEEDIKRELVAFKSFKPPCMQGIQPTLRIFLDLLNTEHNPVEFWSLHNASKFPHIHRIIMYTLAFQASSIFQESVFSSAKDTLTSRRRQLLENAELLEQVVVLRYALNAEVNNSRKMEVKAKPEVVVVLDKEEEEEEGTRVVGEKHLKG